MAAPSSTVWGSIVGGYGRIGLNVARSSTNTTTSVTVQVWFWSKYSISDSGNNLYYDCSSKTGSATTKRGSITLKTSVDTGSGWSTSNQVLLKTYSYSYTRGTSAATRYVYAKYADVDRVGGTMYASTTFSIPALASYKISYNANGGTGAPSAQTKYYGINLKLSSTIPTRTGYSFQGWALTKADADDGKYYYQAGNTCGKNENLTLYAVWKANTYSIKFDANGGTGAPSAQTKTYGVTLKLSTTVPTRTNYNFLGWATSKTATTATYSAGGNYTNNSGTTLYAVWELAYVRPRITGLVAHRYSVVDDRYVIDEQSTTAAIKFDYECDHAVSELLIEWSNTDGDSGEKSYQDLQPSESGVSILLGHEFNVETTYTIRLTITDTLGYSSVTTTLNGMKIAIDTIPRNAGISFGKPAELKDHADFNYTIYPRKGFKNIPIEEDTNMNDLIMPNTYISQDKVASTYLNCPVSGGTFKMDVANGGQQGQIHQTITYTNKKEFRIYHRQYHSGSWPTDSEGNYIWNCVYSAVGKVLWSGNYYMTADHVAPLSEPISLQPHGIVLVFARYNADEDPYAWSSFFVPKQAVTGDTYNASGHTFIMATNCFAVVSTKYLYIRDNQINGNANNNSSGTANGITYNNAAFTLRYVIGV